MKKQPPNITAIQAMGIEMLQAEYKALFPGQAMPNNPKYLQREIAREQQRLFYGEGSEELKKKIDSLIALYDPANRFSFKSRKHDLRNGSDHDYRLPMPGSVITKIYKGQKLEVKVLERGFEYDGKFFKNLSTLAITITGAHWNGYAFFGIKGPSKRRGRTNTAAEGEQEHGTEQASPSD
ncbi:MAG: DUF2924 domain-containing protein [Candidatus Omnitrophica bacterium]|nr:DUF2924 domain-containing protein [Candidatus Omnitrophota bacterium]